MVWFYFMPIGIYKRCIAALGEPVTCLHNGPEARRCRLGCRLAGALTNAADAVEYTISNCIVFLILNDE